MRDSRRKVTFAQVPERYTPKLEEHKRAERRDEQRKRAETQERREDGKFRG